MVEEELFILYYKSSDLSVFTTNEDFCPKCIPKEKK
jgi:hypothetical protein